jgi:O-antigen ligase
VVTVTVLALGVLVAIPSVHRSFTARANNVTTVQNRQALDDAAVAMVQARPLFGFGWERFLVVAPDYFKTTDSYSVEEVANNPVHDVYASIATELGLVGLTLWLVVLCWGVGGAVFDTGADPEVRPWRIALGSIFVLWLVAGLSSPLAASFQSQIIWLWAAVIVGSKLQWPATTVALVPRPVGQDAVSWPLAAGR